MKINVIGNLRDDLQQGYVVVTENVHDRHRVIHGARLPLSDVLDMREFDPNHAEPLQISPNPNAYGSFDGWWLFRRRVVDVKGGDATTLQEVSARIKHVVLREEQAFAKIARELEAFENFSRTADARRERIPESVQLFVWQRDKGHCVKCDSQERLEYDHIIPLSLGGSNTERNIQLLCQHCNREKGQRIS